MSIFVWPSEDGWPYPDTEGDRPIVTDEFDLDDDTLSVHALSTHLYDTLDPVERRVVQARYGLDGQPARSMKELGSELGLARGELRQALGSGLAKLRTQLA